MKSTLLLVVLVVATANDIMGFTQHHLVSRLSPAKLGSNLNMQMEPLQNRPLTRRALGTLLGVGIAYSLAPEAAHAGITEIVTGTSKRKDTLARLKAGDVWIPRLSCFPPDPCMQTTSDKWYDYPATLDGYSTTASGLKVKPLPPLEEMKDIVVAAPFPNDADGTSNVEIIYAGYIVGGATEQQLKEYYDPKSNSSKFYDVRNKDPRLFQFDTLLVNVEKSTLIPGLREALKSMRIGERKSIIIPPELGYGEQGSPKRKGFIKEIPPNATLLFNLWTLRSVR